MVVLIVTFYQYDNYGSRLQNYALCHTIEKCGAYPITLSINSIEENISQHIKKVLALLPTVTNRQRKWIVEYRKQKEFHKFNSRLNIKKMGYGKLKNFCRNNKVIAIAGSDQIWSPAHMLRRPKDMELYFLRFLPKEKRFSYAPSFGTEEIPDKLIDNYKKGIKEFNILSVREPVGQKIVVNLTGRNVPLMPDPTFLLCKEDWEKVANESDVQLPSTKYLLVYFLSEQSEELLKSIEHYADKKHLQIVKLTGNLYHKSDKIPAPDGFLGFIGNAEAVFTDSFHGSVFSIIMNTPFVVFRRTDVDQFTRIEALLKKYALTCAFHDNENQFDFTTILREMNFSYAKELLPKERQKGLDYLEAIIDF